MDEEKRVEAVRTSHCLWKVSAKVYRDARAKENAWNVVARTDRTCTYLNPFLFFCLLCSSSSNSNSNSSSVPFAITACVGAGGALREYCGPPTCIDVRHAVRNDTVL